MPLSAPHRAALANLARKKAGHDVGWISIADARALTELGLAKRNPGGWEITAHGEVELSQANLDDAGADEATTGPQER